MKTIRKILLILILLISILVLLIKFKTIDNFEMDLSRYTRHGRMSCNRVWVEKANEIGEKEYAYLDIKGNVIYGWNKANSNIKYKDYVNNYAIIVEEGNLDTDVFKIIDINGNEILENNVLHVKYSLEKDNKEKEYWYRDFNEEGYAYVVGYIEKNENSEKIDIFFIDSYGIHKFEINTLLSENTYNELIKHIRRIKNYFFIQCEDTSFLMNEEGKQILDFGQICNINPFDIEIISDNEIKLYYWEGVLVYAKFCCTIDFEGNIIHEPELIEP